MPFAVSSALPSSCGFILCISLTLILGFPCGSAGKESAYNVGDLGSIPGLERSPGEGKVSILAWRILKELDVTEWLSLTERIALLRTHYHVWNRWLLGSHCVVPGAQPGVLWWPRWVDGEAGRRLGPTKGEGWLVCAGKDEGGGYGEEVEGIF